jgi:phage gp36-like protein
MAYATEQDILDRYGENVLLTAFDRDGDGAADFGAVVKALADASAEIDGYLVGRHDLPLATVPETLTFMAVDIALYKGSGIDGAGQTEEKRQRYEDAIKFLTQVAKGGISLGLERTSQGGSGGASFTASPRRFTRDSMRRVL